MRCLPPSHFTKTTNLLPFFFSTLSGEFFQRLAHLSNGGTEKHELPLRGDKSNMVYQSTTNFGKQRPRKETARRHPVQRVPKGGNDPRSGRVRISSRSMPILSEPVHNEVLLLDRCELIPVGRFACAPPGTLIRTVLLQEEEKFAIRSILTATVRCSRRTWRKRSFHTTRRQIARIIPEDKKRPVDDHFARIPNMGCVLLCCVVVCRCCCCCCCCCVCACVCVVWVVCVCVCLCVRCHGLFGSRRHSECFSHI